MMQSTDLGLLAERAVAQKLKSDGHKILDQNWKLPVCEIDIISQKANTVYFTEVKYRAKLAYGSGFEYVSKVKQRQMLFSAKIWLAHSRWDGDWRLQAAAVSGLGNESIEIIELE